MGRQFGVFRRVLGFGVLSLMAGFVVAHTEASAPPARAQHFLQADASSDTSTPSHDCQHHYWA